MIERARNICLTPSTEWNVIAAEPASTSGLITGYVVPMAAIGAIAGLIGGSLVGIALPFVGTARVPLLPGLVAAIFVFGMAIVGVFILSLIIDALAPSFGAEQNNIQALKVAAYSYTPLWIAGVLQIVPLLGVLTIFAALYGLYLLYLGLQRVMKSPQDKTLGYTAVVVVCAIVLSVVVGGITSAITGAGMIGASMASSVTGESSSTATVQFDKDSPLGRLQEFGSKMEASAKKMEAAERSGDANAQVAAATEALGTLFGGGRRVEPVGLDVLKPFVPESFAGLPRVSSNSERSGLAGIMVSKAEAGYSDGGQKSISLEISDTGGASGLLGLASWVNVEGEKEDQYGSERTHRVNGRMVHERSSKTGNDGEFSVVLGNRFIVEARGNGVGLSELRSAVEGLGLERLEAMKDAGVQK
jgi:hypothetical protein